MDTDLGSGEPSEHGGEKKTGSNVEESSTDKQELRGLGSPLLNSPDELFSPMSAKVMVKMEGEKDTIN